MGNQSAKASSSSGFSQEDKKVLEAAFRSVSGHSDKLTQDKLLSAWNNVIDGHLSSSTAKYIYNSGRERANSVDFQKFIEPLLIVSKTKMEQQAEFLMGCLDNSNGGGHLVQKDLQDYIIAVVRSYLQILNQMGNQALLSWQKQGYAFTDRGISALSNNWLFGSAKENLDKLELEKWLHRSTIFHTIWVEVLYYLYGTYGGKTHNLRSAPPSQNLLPMCENIPHDSNYTPILDIAHVLFLNNHLPAEKRNKWRFLFSSKIHGESFSTFLGKITKVGPTVLIIEDDDHFIFGGFAPASWQLSPQFHGDSTSMLFTLSPAMRVYNASEYNDHYQYLNLHQQTMPNGLGMGGQFNYWGLWLDQEYGMGQSSPSCTTFTDYKMLSKQKDFKIKSLEVWAVGDPPKKDDDDEDGTHRSVLDKHVEDRVMLDLAGKKSYSDGLREPAQEDYQ